MNCQVTVERQFEEILDGSMSLCAESLPEQSEDCRLKEKDTDKDMVWLLGHGQKKNHTTESRGNRIARTFIM